MFNSYQPNTISRSSSCSSIKSTTTPSYHNSHHRLSSPSLSNTTSFSSANGGSTASSTVQSQHAPFGNQSTMSQIPNSPRITMISYNTYKPIKSQHHTNHHSITTFNTPSASITKPQGVKRAMKRRTSIVKYQQSNTLNKGITPFDNGSSITKIGEIVQKDKFGKRMNQSFSNQQQHSNRQSITSNNTMHSSIRSLLDYTIHNQNNQSATSMNFNYNQQQNNNNSRGGGSGSCGRDSVSSLLRWN